MSFPKDFIWGAATASYQIEGGAQEESKGPSIWDTFSHTPGKVYHGHTGDIACDHFHRFREDCARMKEMGVRNYRFSLSWPRILPEGTGNVNLQGIRFYQELVACLRENGIRPFVTLYHWDLPDALQKRGGWENPDMPSWFEAYVEVVARALGGEVKDFFTLNEPQIFLGLGYEIGIHAPGDQMPPHRVTPMLHNALKAHGLAVQKLRELIPGVRVGVAPCGNPAYPFTESEADINAARAFYFRPNPERVTMSVVSFSDPALLGRYDDAFLSMYGAYLPRRWEADMSVICQPLDYYAQNIYEGVCVRAGADGEPEIVEHPAGFPRTALGWSITPEALYWGPRFLYERYKTPIIISENGMSAHDVISLDGKVHDPNRIDYMHRYLRAFRKSGEDGTAIAGYFAWSLMDNYEWASGYSERFGLWYVDYQTLERIPKDSAYWYRDVMATNGEDL